jgi:hypothetical protein
MITKALGEHIDDVEHGSDARLTNCGIVPADASSDFATVEEQHERACEP